MVFCLFVSLVAVCLYRIRYPGFNLGFFHQMMTQLCQHYLITPLRFTDLKCFIITEFPCVFGTISVLLTYLPIQEPGHPVLIILVFIILSGKVNFFSLLFQIFVFMVCILFLLYKFLESEPLVQSRPLLCQCSAISVEIMVFFILLW